MKLKTKFYTALGFMTFKLGKKAAKRKARKAIGR